MIAGDPGQPSDQQCRLETARVGGKKGLIDLGRRSQGFGLGQGQFFPGVDPLLGQSLNDGVHRADLGLVSGDIEGAIQFEIAVYSMLLGELFDLADGMLRGNDESLGFRATVEPG